MLSAFKEINNDTVTVKIIVLRFNDSNYLTQVSAKKNVKRVQIGEKHIPGDYVLHLQ